MKIKNKIILSSNLLFCFMLVLIIHGAMYEQGKDILVIYSIKIEKALEKKAHKLQSKSLPEIQSYVKSLNQEEDNIRFLISNPDLNKIIGNEKNRKDSMFYKSIDHQDEEGLIEYKDKMYFIGSLKFLSNDQNSLKIIGYLLASEYETETEFHNRFFFIVIPVYMLLSIIITYFVAKMAFKPVVQMVNSVKEITSTNLNKRVLIPKAKDEIYELGCVMNDMIERLEKSFISQRQFIADASHELRTPLTVMRMEVETLLSGETNDEKTENLKSTLSEIDRLNSLCTGLMTSAKIESGQVSLKREEIRIDELLMDISQKFSNRLKKSILFNIEGIAIMNGDYNLLYQLFYNIIDNASKYGNENVQIEIRVINRNEGVMIIKIRDNGPGIKSDELEKVFNRFFRSNEIKAKIDGNGLGLAIAREIAILHKGTISVSSELGNYTEITVKFNQ